MKIFSFLASTMLIVLISQHSIMALPINETTEQPCAAGLERINGQCVPINVTTVANVLETSSLSTAAMIVPTESAVTQTLPLTTSSNVLLESSSLSTATMITPEVTTIAIAGKAAKMEDCPQGTVRDQSGQCQPVEVSTSAKALLESSSLPTEMMLTTEANNAAATTEAGKSDACPPNTLRAQNGQCEPVEPMTTPGSNDTAGNLMTTPGSNDMAGNLMTTPGSNDMAGNLMTTPGSNDMAGDLMTTPGSNDMAGNLMTTPSPVDNIEATTELSEMSRQPVNLMQCPEGTRRDDDGSCQEINPSNRTKTTDPKLLLQKDGSCPNGYKKVNDQCLYIGSKANVTTIPGEFNTLDRVQPRVGTVESSNLNQLVRNNEDGSCPSGTQQYENGLCIITHKPLIPVADSKVTCGEAYELVNGKCQRKSFIQQNQPLGSSTESTNAVTEQAKTDEKVDSTVETMTSENKSDENQSKKDEEKQ